MLPRLKKKTRRSAGEKGALREVSKKLDELMSKESATTMQLTSQVITAITMPAIAMPAVAIQAITIQAITV